MSRLPFALAAPPVRSAAAARRVAGLVAIVFAATSVLTLAAPSPVAAWDDLTFSSSSEADLIVLTNRARANAGLKALKTDSTLTKVARWRSKDMITRDYFSHDIPGYGRVFDKLSDIGYCFKLAGENIGWNNYPDDVATAAIQKMFMDSSGHRENILNSRWDAIGVGAYKGSDGKKMWTVLFADKCGTSPAPTPKPTPKPTAASTPKPTAEPEATTVATPSPAPTASPTPPLPSPTADDGAGLGNGPGGQGNGNGQGGTNGNGGSSGNGTPPGQGATGIGQASAAGPTGLRVVAPPTSTGLLESIVGGVAGLFFGG
jgi:uncharacterized protein YkwD